MSSTHEIFEKIIHLVQGHCPPILEFTVNGHYIYIADSPDAAFWLEFSLNVKFYPGLCFSAEIEFQYRVVAQGKVCCHRAE